MLLLQVIYLLGCVWILRVLTPSYDPMGGDQYCNKTVYIVSLVFISITLGFIILIIGLALLCALCCCCCAGVLAMICPDDDDDGEAANSANLSNN